MRRIPVVVLAVLAWLPVLAAGPEIAWESSLGRAKSVARAEHKPIVVDVWATWCAPCKQMEKSTYPAASVQEALGSFVPVKLDADANGSFLERYRIEAFPTVIVLDEDGWEIGRKRGYVSPEDLSSFLQDAAFGYSAYSRRPPWQGRSRRDAHRGSLPRAGRQSRGGRLAQEGAEQDRRPGPQAGGSGDSGRADERGDRSAPVAVPDPSVEVAAAQRTPVVLDRRVAQIRLDVVGPTARSIMAPAKRLELYQQASTMLWEDAAGIWLYVVPFSIAYQAKFKGLEVLSNERMYPTYVTTD